MFDIKSIPMTMIPGDGVTVVTVKPEDLYPAVIARIGEVLAGANPTELLAISERGGTARAEVLVKNARELPAEAFDDALQPRSQYVDLPYFSFVERNGRAKQNMLDLLAPENRVAVERMIARGFALEIAMGWFCQALRLSVGAYDLTIEKNEDYRL